jgi:hypothetical protein
MINMLAIVAFICSCLIVVCPIVSWVDRRWPSDSMVWPNISLACAVVALVGALTLMGCVIWSWFVGAL